MRYGRLGLVLWAIGLAGCGSHGQAARSAAPSSTATEAAQPATHGGSKHRGKPKHAKASSLDWTQFDYNAQRSGVGPASTGITAGNLGQLTRRTVSLDGTVDSSVIELHAIKIQGHARDVLVMTTTYGKTIAIDARTGAKLWEFTPSDIGTYEGSPQITTATPIADPDRRFVYAASPDGLIHKLSLSTGGEVRSGNWPVAVTLLPSHEKIASALNLSGGSLLVPTDGFDGDTPPYQGHVVRISLATGAIQEVWNSLCSNVDHLMQPSSCPQSDSAIWGRSGAVVEPGSGRVLVATSNGVSDSTVSFNGTTYWSDSVLELSPTLQLLHNWTPSDQLHLTQEDLDLGSTSPALLPQTGGQRLAVQGGKSGVLALLNLNALDGTTGPAGPKTGGELQDINAPGPTDVFSQPAVWTSHSGRTYVFVGDAAGTAAYVLGSDHRLSVAWQDSTPGTSPVIAGGLLYVYDELHGAIVIRDPTSEHALASLPVGTGHWNSPIVVGGRIILPEGDANAHRSTGTLDIYHLPGH